MISGAVHLDCRHDNEAADRKAAGDLYGIEPGSRVILFVANRAMWSPYLIDQARQFVSTLHLEVQGSPRAVETWVRALRDVA